MAKKHTWLVIISSLVLMSNISHAETILTEEEVLSLISGKTIQGIYLGQQIPFESYFDPNGSAHQKRNGENIEGEWFVDKKGRHCIKWEGKERKCRIVMHDNEEYREFIINNKTGKREYSLIINKLSDGNPRGIGE